MHERAKVEKSKYDPLELAKSTFSYMMLDEGVFGRRQLSCFCVPCFGSRGPGAGTTDSNLVCRGCSWAGNAQRVWHEQECLRTDAQGIAERRMAAQREGHRLGANTSHRNSSRNSYIRYSYYSWPAGGQSAQE